MCLTANFTDANSNPQKCILNFSRLAPSRMRLAILMLFPSLTKCGKEDKVSTITMDNASSNVSAVGI